MAARLVGFLVVAALAGFGCGDKSGTDSDAPNTGDPTGTATATGTGTGTGTATGTGSGTGTGTGTTSVDPPIADYSNCVAVGEKVETTAGNALRLGLRITYDANGLIEYQEQDVDANGSYENNWMYAYDAQGRRTDEWNDVNGDGNYEYHGVLTWSVNDNIASLSFDTDNDGTFESVYTYTEDGNGNRILQEGDTDNDGTIDSHYDWIYTGTQLDREQEDIGIDGTYETFKDYTYPGLVGGDFRVSSDTNGDGVVDSLGEQAYDGDRILFYWEDRGPNTIVDAEIHYSYFANGVSQGYLATFFDVALVPLTGGYFDQIVEETYDVSNGRRTRTQELADLERDGAMNGNDVLWTTSWTYTGCAVP